MAKATHNGSCQLCERQQKLPGDRLSLHGYKVQWSSFMGTCPGSRELPYEMSCDLLPGRLEWARKLIVDLTEMIARLNEPATTARAWVREYERGKRGMPGSYRTVQRDLYMKPQVPGSDFLMPFYRDEDYHGNKLDEERAYTLSFSDVYGKTLLDIATDANRKHAAHKACEKAELERYAAWCEDRIKNWKLAPLAGVGDVAAPTPKETADKAAKAVKADAKAAWEMAKQAADDKQKADFDAALATLRATGNHEDYWAANKAADKAWAKARKAAKAAYTAKIEG